MIKYWRTRKARKELLIIIQLNWARNGPTTDVLNLGLGRNRESRSRCYNGSASGCLIRCGVNYFGIMEGSKPAVAVSASLQCQNLFDQNDEEEGHKSLVFNYPMILIHGRLIEDSVVSHKDSVTCQEPAVVSCEVADDTEIDRRMDAGDSEQSEERNPETMQTVLVKSSDSTARARQIPNYRIEKLTDAILEPNSTANDHFSANEPSKVISEQKVICKSSPLNHIMSWPISEDGESKIFVPLVKGQNLISFKHEKSEDILYQLKVTYEPLQNKRLANCLVIEKSQSYSTMEAPLNMPFQ